MEKQNVQTTCSKLEVAASSALVKEQKPEEDFWSGLCREVVGV